jgi:hypothetical protein
MIDNEKGEQNMVKIGQMVKDQVSGVVGRVTSRWEHEGCSTMVTLENGTALGKWQFKEEQLVPIKAPDHTTRSDTTLLSRRVECEDMLMSFAVPEPESGPRTIYEYGFRQVNSDDPDNPALDLKYRVCSWSPLEFVVGREYMLWIECERHS